ncbi:PREDICTED: uncharacterized protein LOC104603211 [Nelumbo nucifera]|uniref:Uncharacterized protein LOC104603211 n=1 Tax=Nelumbo nucifera TaxID=4432 RepID=A0A1U8AI28_NELNU|nr:PREDICTED: uncharacterized protein LOC104603211 [Nelumbo nucifera]
MAGAEHNSASGCLLQNEQSGKQSRARILQLKRQLQTLKKGSLSISDYIQKEKAISDKLSAILEPISNFDLILYILSGLSNEYESLVMAIANGPDVKTMSFNDHVGLLLNHEAWIEQHAQLVDGPATNVAHSSSKNKHSYNNQPNQYNFRGCSRGSGNSHGDRGSRQPKIVCQVCKFEATHHFTPNMNNMQSKVDYMGNEQVKIGNGNSLPIQHIGSTRFQFNGHNMNNICHVPHITKNLLSVSKFNNDVVFEFHKDYFLIKDKWVKVLLHSSNCGGLYQMPTVVAVRVGLNKLN